jgi:hypothetical protein
MKKITIIKKPNNYFSVIGRNIDSGSDFKIDLGTGFYAFSETEIMEHVTKLKLEYDLKDLKAGLNKKNELILVLS